MKNKFVLGIILLVSLFQFASAAHYVVGYVNDAFDGTAANGHEVVVWNPANGGSDNVTGTIGPTGESYTDKMYMVDCELLSTPCEVGDEIRIRVFDNGDNYVSNYTNITVTGAGYDFADNLTLNSPIIFSSVVVDDDLKTPVDEIDLLAGLTRKVTCEAVAEDLDGGNFGVFSAVFYSTDSSSYGGVDDNNNHYTNSSCFVNESYGNENQSYITCSFDTWYYANAENWQCTIKGSDLLVNATANDTTKINELLAIEVNDSLDFGRVNSEELSNETVAEIFNRGNVMIDLALSGYGQDVGDGLAMVCERSQNISIENKKYNLSASHPGELNLSDADLYYTNLTSSPVVEDFNLNFRQDDAVEDAFNFSYWRIYVPFGTGGNCTGNIVFSAVSA